MLAIWFDAKSCGVSFVIGKDKILLGKISRVYNIAICILGITIGKCLKILWVQQDYLWLYCDYNPELMWAYFLGLDC